MTGLDTSGATQVSADYQSGDWWINYNSGGAEEQCWLRVTRVEVDGEVVFNAKNGSSSSLDIDVPSGSTVVAHNDDQDTSDTLRMENRTENDLTLNIHEDDGYWIDSPLAD